MDTAVVFLNERAWLADVAECFDVRFDAQLLPKGSIVVGFMVWQNGRVQELLSKPHTHQNQEKYWDFTLAYARAIVKDEGLMNDNRSGPSPKEVSLLATDDKREGHPSTCLNWRRGMREEKHEAQAEEERYLAIRRGSLSRSGSVEQALP